MMPELRQFLYLDDDVVQQFLEQIEGGAFEEEAVSRHDEREQTTGEAHLYREERAVTVRQTAASRFDRLQRRLAADGSITSLEGVDDDLWSGLAVTAFVQVSGSIVVPDIVRQMAAIAGIEQVLPLVEMANELMDPDRRIPASEIGEVRQKLPLMSAAAQEVLSRPVPCIVSVTASPRFKFLSRLSRTCLLSSIDDLEGEATVFGRIQRKLGKGQSEAVDQELLGLPRQARRDRRKGGQAPLVKLGYPGAVLSPIAIWR